MKILLVEDHDDTSRLMSRLLRSSGHDVTVAGGVESALSAAAESPFDLLISDIGLPDGSGLELMRQLRERTPIRGIALSGYGNPEDVKESKAAGFEVHVIKPVEYSKLQKWIETIKF